MTGSRKALPNSIMCYGQDALLTSHAGLEIWQTLSAVFPGEQQMGDKHR